MFDDKMGRRDDLCPREQKPHSQKIIIIIITPTPIPLCPHL
jgi:hypothetical protein